MAAMMMDLCIHLRSVQSGPPSYGITLYIAALERRFRCSPYDSSECDFKREHDGNIFPISNDADEQTS